MTIKRITTDAVLTALAVALSFFSVELGFVKLTLVSVPIFVAGGVFGIVDGIIVGALGTVVEQLVRYGISPTTILWMLPYMFCGFFAGLILKKQKISYISMGPAVVGAEVGIFLLTTLAIYVDMKVYNYFTVASFYTSMTTRLIAVAVKSIVFTIGFVPLFQGIRKIKK